MGGYIGAFIGGAADAAAQVAKQEILDRSQRERDEANFIRQKELARINNDYATTRMESEQTWRTGEREAGQTFTAGENALNRTSQEKQAATRSGETRRTQEEAAVDKWYRDEMAQLDQDAQENMLDESQVDARRKNIERMRQQQFKDIDKRYSGGKLYDAPKNPSASGGATFNGQAIPQAAVDALKNKDPMFSEAAFDQKYGKGAAAHVLGKPNAAPEAAKDPAPTPPDTAPDKAKAKDAKPASSDETPEERVARLKETTSKAKADLAAGVAKEQEIVKRIANTDLAGKTKIQIRAMLKELEDSIHKDISRPLDSMFGSEEVRKQRERLRSALRELNTKSK